MMRKLALVACAVSSLAIHAAQAEGVPAAFVLSLDLKGVDEATRMVIERNGVPQPAKLMMPLYAGDTIVLRDAASKLSLEMDGGAEKEIAAADGRVELKGEVETGDGTWNLISSIAGVIGGEEEEAVPDNMVSRAPGDDLKVPMATHGANFVVAGAPVWLAWSGGKGPYTLTVEADGAAPATITAERQDAEIAAPAGVDRFGVTITDAEGRTATVRFRVKTELPKPADGIVPAGEAAALIEAAWLTGQNDGAWTVAAVQTLHKLDSPQAKQLAAKIVGGWKFGG